jgi:hypothetical protein
METQLRPYTHEEYKAAIDAVYNFHNRCYETVREYLEGHGKIEIDPDQYDDWRFDFLEYDETMTVHEICLDGDGIYLVCYTLSQHIIDWEQINHDMVITEKIMDLVYELSENE